MRFVCRDDITLIHIKLYNLNDKNSKKSQIVIKGDDWNKIN